MRHYACKRTRRRTKNLVVDLPDFPVEIPEPKELAAEAAKDQAATLKKRLSRLGGRYRGLARASIGSVSHSAGEVTLKNRPDGSVGRMDGDLGLTNINEGTLEGSLQRVIDKAM